MIVLADTHALVWWLTDPDRLGPAAQDHLDAAAKDEEGGVLVSVASRIDLHYLARKRVFTASQTDAMWSVTQDPATNVRAAPVTSRVAVRFGDPAILASSLADPWDRLIVATALELAVPLVTKDREMHQLAPAVALTVVW